MKNDWNKNKIDIIYKKEFGKFITFWRFNTALLLLNYSGKPKERNFFYKKINQSTFLQISEKNFYNLLLKLPFPVFMFLISPMYYIYKRIK